MKGQSGEGVVASEYGNHAQLLHMSQSQLDYIVSEVYAEGFHVERISHFGNDKTSMMELMQVISEWAKSVNLKVGFNHSQDICVFERI